MQVCGSSALVKSMSDKRKVRKRRGYYDEPGGGERMELKKQYAKILSAILLLSGTIWLTGCYNRSFSQPNQNTDDRTEIYSTENTITEISFHMQYGNIKICPAAESDRNLADNEILIESDTGENVPEIFVNIEDNELRIEENEKLKPRDAAGYNLYVYLPDDRVYDVIEIMNENSYVDLTGNLHIKKMLVDLNVAADVNILDAAIDDLDIHTTMGKASVQLRGEPQDYDYDLFSDQGYITLNEVKTDEDTNEIIQKNNAEKSVTISALGNVSVQIDK